MRLQGSSTDSLEPTVQSICVSEEAGHFLSPCTLIGWTHTCIRVLCRVYIYKKKTHTHNVFHTMWLEWGYFWLTKWDYRWSLKRERPAHAYILNISHMMTHVNVHLARRHITNFELLICTCIQKKKKKVIIPRLKQNYHRVCFYPSSCPTREGLLMKQFWQLVYEAAWYIYVFIYLSFFNLLYTFSEKKMWFWIWGNWRICTKCSETNRLKWSKMPTRSDWLQPER